MVDELIKLGYDSTNGSFQRGYITAIKYMPGGTMYLSIGLDLDAVNKSYYKDKLDGMHPGYQQVLHFDEIKTIAKLYDDYQEYLKEVQDV